VRHANPQVTSAIYSDILEQDGVQVLGSKLAAGFGGAS